MRKTKIVCTLGPATDAEGVLEEMIKSGMNVARFNFSHGEHKEHAARMEQLRQLREKLCQPVAIMLDTKGPEVRIGPVENGGVLLIAGSEVVLTTRNVIGTSSVLPVNYAGLPRDVRIGNHLLIDDGNLDLICENVTGTDLKCRVIFGGMVKPKKGVNVPGVKLSMPYLSQKDKQDILFGIEQGVDYIAASFVTCAEDVLQIRALLQAHGAEDIHIISKIENRDGVDNLDEILAVSDGIMVARGDMGVEIPFEELPEIQKYLIRKGVWAGKKVITATQMLESMITHPRPTRAETNDVANAIYDGTSAIMLSGETSVGAYPVMAVRTMDTIARQTEKCIDYAAALRDLDSSALTGTITDAVSHATCTMAQDLKATALVTMTTSGETARMLSKFRPGRPIISCTPNERTYRQLALSWGVVPMLTEKKESTDELCDLALELVQKTGLVSRGDIVVLTMGVPLGISGCTNMLRAFVV